MTAPTGPSARPTVPPAQGSTTSHTGAGAAEPPVDPQTTRFAAAVARTRRTVTLRVAAIIAVVAFLVGLGVSMLVGPVLGGGPGGPGGPGGQGGPPGASTSQAQTGTTAS